MNKEPKINENQAASPNMYHETRTSTESSLFGNSASSSHLLDKTALSKLPQGPTQLDLWFRENERHEDIAYRLTTSSPRTFVQAALPEGQDQHKPTESKKMNSTEGLDIYPWDVDLFSEFEDCAGIIDRDLQAPWHNIDLSCWDGL